MHDVVIVGGGPAGISTALHLQAAAPHLRLLVLEKCRYPRDKICAGGIGARAFRILEAIGVEVDCPCVPLDAVAMRLPLDTMVVHQPGCGAVVRRIEFDHAFAKVAMGRGIEVREDSAVTDVRVSDSHVELAIAGADPIQARAVVGADGVAGPVRRLAGFPRGELRAQVVELDTEAAPQDLPRDTVVFDFATSAMRGYAWDFPTQVAGKPLVCRGAYVLHDGKQPHAPGEPRARMAAYLSARGLDLADYTLKQFAEQGFEPGACVSKPRVLLAGESAGIDIATGEGIGQAIEYGALAGPYLAHALAVDDLRFADWRETIDRRHLGLQMAIRHGCYRALYGRHRPIVERLLPRIPHLMRLGVQDFAGVPLSGIAMLRGAAQLVSTILRRAAR
ncbi:MAG: NAD(P)/FAD-dependent oxidoreductase [Kofleriaceae bacterium]